MFATASPVGYFTYAIVVVILVSLIYLWIAATRSILSAPWLSREGRVGWIIAIFVAPLLGAVAWFAIQRRRE